MKKKNVFNLVCRKSKRPQAAMAELSRLGLQDVTLENRLEVRNENGNYEIILMGAVGGSWWDDSGITEKEFRDALGKIPKGSKITILVNSEGGSVQEGLGIYNAIKDRSEEITARITGYAVSIASVFPLAAGKVISPKSAIWMMHQAWSFAQGNADDMENAAKMLREHNEALIDIYVAETGKTRDEWEQWMKDETWVRGSKAIDYGLADETDDEEGTDSEASYRPMHPDFLTRCKNISPEILNCISALPNRASEKNNNNKNNMNKEQKIALLATWGITVNVESTSDARIDELLAMGRSAAEKAVNGKSNPEPAEPVTMSDVNNIISEMKVEMNNRATLALLVSETRITQSQADNVLKLPVAQQASQIAILRENPVRPAPADPVKDMPEITAESSVQEIEKHISLHVKNQERFLKTGNSDCQVAIRNSAITVANTIAKHRNKLLTVLNANTTSANLKRNVILSEILRAFATRITPLRAFSTVFGGIRLEGTDIVSVPYFPLVSTASTDFNQANGYVMGDSTHDAKTVTINKRKYQPIRFNSSELARQPALNLMQIAEIKAEKLGVDVFTDVLSVVTAANFGAAAFTGAANTFDSSDVADIKGVCDVAEWPDAGRSLIVKSAYDINLLKDSTVKSALNFGSADPVQNGSVQKILGFNYYMCNSIPANAENLVGLAAFPSGIVVATSPITPSDEVRNQLSGYELVIDPTTGISFEYRRWGNADFDETREVIECNYGFGVGEAAGIKRLVSA